MRFYKCFPRKGEDRVVRGVWGVWLFNYVSCILSVNYFSRFIIVCGYGANYLVWINRDERLLIKNSKHNTLFFFFCFLK